MSDKTRNTYRWERIGHGSEGAWLYRGNEKIGHISELPLAERIVIALNLEARAEVGHEAVC